MMRLIIFSLFLIGCAGIPKPDTDICVVNAPAKHLKCYNMLRDYDDNGQLKPDAQATFRPASSLSDVNKYIGTDPDDFARLKAYIKQLREEVEQRCR